MSFFSSLFGGQNKTLNSGINTAGQVSQNQIGTGEKLTGLSADWLSGLLSGDTSKVMQLLSPQVSALKQRGQQEKQTTAQFGNRAGGTNAKMATADDTTRSEIGSMISKLTGEAVSGAGTIGTSMLDTGMKALNTQVDFSQQQMENWAKSILGQGVGEAAGAAEGAALSAIGA